MLSAKLQRILVNLALLFFPIIIFSLILGLPLSSKIDSILKKGNSYLPFIAILVLLFYLINKKTGRIIHLYNLLILSILYAFGLSFYWNSGFTPDLFAIFGYLPINDAANYYSAAYALLAGLKIGWAQASYRPIFPMLLSSLLAITALNPMIVLGILTFLNLLGSYLAANEIRKTHGSLAASLFLVLSFVYYRYFMGLFMSEQLGFLLGNLALAMIWNGIRNRRIPNILIGLFCLSFGLNVRPGGMFTLLMLVIWIGLTFNKKKWFSLKRSVLGFICVLLGFLINTYISNTYLMDPSRTFSNWGYQLYGVAAGNAGWKQLTIDFPGTPPEEAMDRAIEKIIQNPKLFVKGIVLTYQDYLDPTGNINLFAFLKNNNNEHKLVLWVWMGLGLLFLLRHPKKPLNSFLLLSFAGILLSIPFAPPRDGGWRLYAVTNPILICIVVAVLPWLSGMISSVLNKAPILKENENKIQEAEYELDQFDIFPWSSVLIITILFLVLVLPRLLVPKTRITYTTPEYYCAEGEIPVGFWTHRNAWIQTVPAEMLPKGMFLPYMTPERIEQAISNSGYFKNGGYEAMIPHLSSGSSLAIMPYNFYVSSHFPDLYRIFVIANTEILPESSGFITLCGNVLPRESFLKAHIYVATDSNLKNTPENISMMPFQTQRLVTVSILALTCLLGIDSICTLVISEKLKKRLRPVFLRVQQFWNYLDSE